MNANFMQLDLDDLNTEQLAELLSLLEKFAEEGVRNSVTDASTNVDNVLFARLETEKQNS